MIQKALKFYLKAELCGIIVLLARMHYCDHKGLSFIFVSVDHFLMLFTYIYMTFYFLKTTKLTLVNVIIISMYLSQHFAICFLISLHSMRNQSYCNTVTMV